MKLDSAVDAVKVAPPAGYLLGAAAGIDWGTVASVLACLYTAALLGEKVYRWVQGWRARRPA